MTFINNNFQKKESIFKPVLIIICIIAIIGATYHFFGDKNQISANAGNVEEIIANWVDENPDKILDSIKQMQIKESKNRVKNASKNIKLKKDQLLSNDSPQYAPKKYDVTIVEFFDYNCGYCKKARDNVDQLLKSDKKVRVIFKEYPILGQQSIEMATIAIAVNLNYPKSYFKFHNALMKSREKGKDGAYKIAKSIGLNVKKLENSVARDADKIAKIITANMELGQSIGVTGTPGFVIGDELLPGAYPVEVMKEKIALARKNK